MTRSRRGPSLVAIACLLPLLLLRISSGNEETRASQGVTTGSTAPDRSAELRSRLEYEGTPVPGSRIEIGPEGPFPSGVSFHWTQLEGPPVPIDSPDSPRLRFVVPEGADRLSFRLSIRDDEGERSTVVTVPVASGSARKVEASGNPKASGVSRSGPPLPVAEAGDDQIGLVGRRITLNGVESRPKGNLGYRWIKQSGAEIADARQEGAYFSFVPEAPGTYRFLLVVASGNAISEADEVEVEVGIRPPAASAAPNPGPRTLGQWVTSTVSTIPDGSETSRRIARVFEEIAGRTPLYSTYADLQSELSRRLELAVPGDASIRALWARRVFEPLTQVTAPRLLSVGIDLRQPSTTQTALGTSQREQIRSIYLGLAEAFRPPHG